SATGCWPSRRNSRPKQKPWLGVAVRWNETPARFSDRFRVADDLPNLGERKLWDPADSRSHRRANRSGGNLQAGFCRRRELGALRGADADAWQPAIDRKIVARHALDGEPALEHG